MLKSWLDKWRATKAVVDFVSTPLGALVQRHCVEFFKEFPQFGEEMQNSYGKELLNILATVSESADEFLGLREAIADQVYVLADYQVLALTEKERPLLGVEDIPYVTGTLHHHIEACVEHNATLKQLVWENDDMQWGHDELVEFCNLRCARCKFIVSGLNKIRITLKDYNEKKDWFRPYFQAMLIFCESVYWGNLSDQYSAPIQPRPFTELIYSSFFDHVFNGHANPFHSFEKLWQETAPENEPHYLLS